MHCLYMCVHITVLNYCTEKQNKAVLIIFPLSLQTIPIAQMLSTGGEGAGNTQLLSPICLCNFCQVSF